MYKLIGDDKKEYGPLSVEQIRQWISEGRVNSQTKVQTEGSAEWKSLGEFAELAGLLKGSVAPPPIPPSLPVTPSKTSGMAIASLVLGILGVFTFGATALVGLILGIISLVKINKSNGALRGSGLALAGTIVSGVFLLMLPVVAALLLPALANAKSKAQAIICMTNMKQLALGSFMYADNNKGQLPSGPDWCDTVQKYVRNEKAFQCPGGNRNQRCHYAFNSQLSGVKTKSVTSPAQTVLLFESDGGWNASGGIELMVKKSRHQRAMSLVFVDGHSEIVRESRLQAVRWEP